MPELPDITIYVERLNALIVGKRLDRVRVASPFVVRSYDPPLSDAQGRIVQGLERIGKRIVLGLEDELFVVLHLMIAGRLHWRKLGAKMSRGYGLIAFDFPAGTLLFTEASKQKRASLHVVRGTSELTQFDRGGINPLTATASGFRAALLRENRTLKRALTDPRLFDGIGNAYSDEILFAARLSPVTLTQRLGKDEIVRLRRSCREVLETWTERLRREVGSGFPEQVTAFHPAMAVHGRYKKPCPDCGTAVQRIRYAANEVNYCPRCQTDGKVLADRSLSRLLKQDWPSRIEELEERWHEAPASTPRRP